MSLPSVQITSELAPKLREIVCSTEGGLLPLTILTDEQLMLAAKGVHRDWPIQRIAQQLYTYKVKGEGLTWSQLLGLMPELKRRILGIISADNAVDERPETLDPLAENAALIRDLRTEYDEWTKRVKDDTAPSKEMFDHVARLGRLLLEATANHATIRNKLGLSTPASKNNQAPHGPDVLPPARSEFSAENMQIVFTGLSGDGMPDFLESARLKMEAAAKIVVNPGSGPPNSVKPKRTRPAKDAPKRPVGRPRKGT